MFCYEPGATRTELPELCQLLEKGILVLSVVSDQSHSVEMCCNLAKTEKRNIDVLVTDRQAKS
jgi:hypothetical protein